jgi:hypothetical protein
MRGLSSRIADARLRRGPGPGEGLPMTAREQLEAFWPTRRVHLFDGFCRRG